MAVRRQKSTDNMPDKQKILLGDGHRDMAGVADLQAGKYWRPFHETRELETALTATIPDYPQINSHTPHDSPTPKPTSTKDCPD